DLTAPTCERILQLPQIADVYGGGRVTKIRNFRQASLVDGPLTAMARILYGACSQQWLAVESQIRTMASRQQVLLQEDWVNRLSDKVDAIIAKIGNAAYRQAISLDGPDDVGVPFGSLGEVLGFSSVRQSP